MYGLYRSHAYAIIGYNASTNTFTLYNPWGFDQPGQLTWSQLQATCTQLCVCNTSGSVPISGAPGTTSSAKASSSLRGWTAAAAWTFAQVDGAIGGRSRRFFLRCGRRDDRSVPGSGEQQRGVFTSAPPRRSGVHRSLAVSGRRGLASVSRVDLIGQS